MTMDNPFGYLTFGGTFRRTFGLFLDRFDLYMAISAVIMVPFIIVFLSVTGLLILSLFQGSDPEQTAGVKGFLLFCIEFVVYGIATMIGRGAVNYAVAKIYLDESVEWRECLKVAWTKKWPLLGASCLVDGSVLLAWMIISGMILLYGMNPNGFTTALMVMALILFLFGFAYAYSGLLLISPSIMVEGIRPIRAIQRSWELSTGSGCYLVCTMTCLYFCLIVLNAFLMNLFGSGNILSPIDMTIHFIPLSLYFPLHAIIQTVLYLNLRVGRESMNHTVLSGDLTSAPSPASRFQNTNPTAQDSMDYRHVPLMDGEGNEMTQVIPSAV